jgi:hypothetical protein
MEEKLKNLCEFDVLDDTIKVYDFSHHYEKIIYIVYDHRMLRYWAIDQKNYIIFCCKHTLHYAQM